MISANMNTAAALVRPLADEVATVALGEALGRAIGKRAVVIHLEGGLGAGKTTLSRGILRAFGHAGVAKSPTYTLVEPYELPDVTVYHFDLYRVVDPEELELMGIRDYFCDTAVCLVEWPERGASLLPSPDLSVQLAVAGLGRLATLVAHSSRGCAILDHLC